MQLQAYDVISYRTDRVAELKLIIMLIGHLQSTLALAYIVKEGGPFGSLYQYAHDKEQSTKQSS